MRSMVAVCRRLIAPNVQKKVFLPGGATATSTSAVQVSDLTCDLTNMLSILKVGTFTQNVDISSEMFPFRL